VLIYYYSTALLVYFVSLCNYVSGMMLHRIAHWPSFCQWIWVTCIENKRQSYSQTRYEH